MGISDILKAISPFSCHHDSESSGGIPYSKKRLNAMRSVPPSKEEVKKTLRQAEYNVNDYTHIRRTPSEKEKDLCYEQEKAAKNKIAEEMYRVCPAFSLDDDHETPIKWHDTQCLAHRGDNYTCALLHRLECPYGDWSTVELWKKAAEQARSRKQWVTNCEYYRKEQQSPINTKPPPDEPRTYLLPQYEETEEEVENRIDREKVKKQVDEIQCIVNDD